MRKKIGIVAAAGLLVCSLASVGVAKEAAKGKAGEKAYSGEAEFKEHCAVCHPDGGNIIKPNKTLHKKDMDANKIKTVDDIVKVMRNPGPGMNKFDKKAIPDKEAKAIAEYILKTFK